MIANAGRTENLAKVRVLLGVVPVETESREGDTSAASVQPTFICPDCGAAMVVIEVFAADNRSVRHHCSAFDAATAGVVEAEGVLHAAEFTVGVTYRVSQCSRNEAEFSGDAEQGNVAEVAAQTFVGAMLSRLTPSDQRGGVERLRKNQYSYRRAGVTDAQARQDGRHWAIAGRQALRIPLAV